MNGNKGSKLAKASLAKTNKISYVVYGDYADEAQQFDAMTQDFGITFDSNNNISYNGIKTDVSDIQNALSSGYTGNVSTSGGTLVIVDGLITGVI